MAKKKSLKNEVVPEKMAQTAPKPKNKKRSSPSTLKCANESRCSNYVYAPIFKCDVGHALCIVCTTFYHARCPLCRTPLPRTVAFDLETRAEELLQCCVFRPQGCHFRFPKDQLHLHQVECRYAQKECFSQRCGFLGDNEGLFTHMENIHGERVVKSSEAEFTLRKIVKRTDDVVHLQYMRCILGDFWIKYMYSGSEKQLYGAVQYIGPKQEAEKLEYEFEMREYDNEFTGLKAIYNGKMFTHTKSFETIFDSEECFTCNLGFAHYFENNDVLHIIVRVQEIEKNL